MTLTKKTALRNNLHEHCTRHTVKNKRKNLLCKFRRKLKSIIIKYCQNDRVEWLQQRLYGPKSLKYLLLALSSKSLPIPGSRKMAEQCFLKLFSLTDHFSQLGFDRKNMNSHYLVQVGSNKVSIFHGMEVSMVTGDANSRNKNCQVIYNTVLKLLNLSKN